MKKFIKHYKNKNEDKINLSLLKRQSDIDVLEYLINTCKSLEILKYVKFKGYDFITDESKIDFNHYIRKRKINDTKHNKNEKYRYLRDSRYSELRLKFDISCKGKSKRIIKRLLVPVMDEDGYFYIKGNKYLLIYQIVDASTYTTKHNLILKSLMPLSLKRSYITKKNTQGDEITAPVYSVTMFNKSVDVLLFYFARMGVTQTLNYFSLNMLMNFTEEEKDTESNMYFKIRSDLFIEVNKEFFNKYPYVQSVVFMILNICTNRVTLELLYNKKYWIEKIGSLYTTNQLNHYDKGITTIISFTRMMDKTTSDLLRVHSENKEDVYSVIRWMIQNFIELRKKNNLDMNNKRLRCNEYISAILTQTFSDTVQRIVSEGKGITIERIEELFSFNGDILLTKLHKSGLLRYDDTINDMDFFNKLRTTIKGPNSMGNKNENNIPVKYRGIHPSQIGKNDINVCGSSDPGTSGVITPFCEMSGLYFSDKDEPDDFKFVLSDDINRYLEDKGVKTIILKYKDSEEYYTSREKLMDNIRGCKVKVEDIESDMLYINVLEVEEY